MGTTAQKLEYLGTTKSQLKDMINYGLPTENQITNETTFRNYVKGIFEAFIESLRDSTTLYTNLPKTSVSGSQITLNGTAYAPMRITLNPTAISQDGTPTPSSPQDIHTISGDNSVVVNGKNYIDLTKHTNTLASNTTILSPNSCQCEVTGSWQGEISIPLYLDKNTDYTISAKVDSTATRSIINYIRGYRSDNTYTNIVVNQYYYYFRNGYRFNSGEYESYKLDLSIAGNGSPTGTLVLDELMIEKGTTKTSFIPYQEPQTAPINLPVENLFNDNYYNDITLYAKSTNYYCFVKMPNEFKTHFYGNMFLKGTQQQNLVLGFSNSTTTIPSRILNSGTITNNVEYDFTNDENVYLIIANGNGLTIADDVPKIFNNYNIMVSFSKVNSYTPYGTTPIEYCKIGNYEDEFILTSGKNIVNALDTSSMINFTKSGDTFTTSALTSSGYGGIGSATFTNSVPITKSGTVYFSADIRLVSGTAETLNGIWDKALTRTNASWVNKPTLSNQFQRYCYKYDVNAGDSFTGFAVQLYNCSNAVLEVKNIMFSYSSDYEYEPYGTNQWYLKKNIGKVVLDGSESNWNTSGLIVAGYKSYYIGYLPNEYAGINNREMLCNNFTLKTFDDWLNLVEENFFENAGINIGFRIDENIASDLATFKTWLSTHNTDIYYPLLTPTYTQITGTLETQLNNIYEKLLSYKGTTNISQVNNDLPFVINASAIKDLE